MMRILRSAFLIIMAVLFLTPNLSSALSPELLKAQSRGAFYYDPECSPIPTSNTRTTTVESGSIKDVFMVGDSITYTATLPPHNAKEEFKKAGYTATISGSGGATITTAGSNGDRLSGLQAVQRYKSDVSRVNAIIVALGTNHSPDGFEESIKEMVKEIRKYNQKSPIFWVNTDTKDSSNPAYSAEGSKKKNEMIERQSTKLDFTVIDIADANIPLDADNIHPSFDASGIGKWIDTVIKGLQVGGKSPSSASGSSTDCACGGGDEDGAKLTGEDNAEKIWNFLIDMGFTPEQAAGFLGNFWVETGGTFEPDTEEVGGGGGYGIAQWTDRRAALEAYAKRKGQDVGTLELQLAFLKYELEGSEAAAYDQIKKAKTVDEAWVAVSVYYERPAEPDNPDRGKYAQEYFEKFEGRSAGGSSSSSSGNCEGGSGSAFVSGDYAWPIDLGKDEVSAGYSLPCKTSSCHHDGTPAFDLAHKTTVSGGNDGATAGVAVFAIADGEIVKNDIYQGISGCYAIEYKAKDGFVYWYGHIASPTSQGIGKQFKVGDKIAEVGERDCTGNGSYPHLHIDRGSPKGTFGGMVCCRDAGMNDVINGLYEELGKQ